jgi:tRNA threonylcarbamoyladenosine modification (KEOPS) complex  Pcc1 subunit
MTKFHFRLASVLRLREMQLAVELEKLQVLLHEIAQKERSLAAMSEERTSAVEFVQKQTGAGHAELRALSAFLLGTSGRAAQLRESVARTKSLAAEQRQRVTLAQRDERLLLKLKAAKLSEWQAQYDRELETVAQDTWTAVQNVLRRRESTPGR